MTLVAFKLPDVGEGLAEAEIIEWLVAVGDTVEADQPVVIVETAKAQVELPAPTAGRLMSRPHEPGDVVAVGDTLFDYEIGSESASTVGYPSLMNVGPAGAALGAASASSGLTDDSIAQLPSGDPPSAPSGSQKSPSHPGVDTRNRRALAAPSTRKFAIEQGVDLAGLMGSGPNGRIEVGDVRAAIHRRSTQDQRNAQGAYDPARPTAISGEASRGVVEKRPLRGLRRQIARAMTATLSVPHITDYREIDAAALIAARSALQGLAAPGDKMSLLPLLVCIVLAALREHPTFNANYDSHAEELTLFAQPDIGIATATQDGLLVPVVKAASQYSIAGLSQELNRLVSAGRDRVLRPDETRGATFTISNFGSFGAWLGTPLIAPPQVAIAGFGRARDAVVAENGVPNVRPILPVAVAADHRVIDGADLGAFVNTIEKLVRNPLLLLGER
ncbi:hypothetical protein A5784_03655 [Mycobacterium sp. 852013-50091_SCH5140682]|uniref:dihydrolipoamide acetyltransferase family protein n=1 Tax=Mycobacterium sp. 852013-50091_SCH5140682 TaxID=1834109 RepID=UPI0007EA5FEA|nr:dihydrolipoamide acetyltransferase family protein [Mycobacterium sp. 852013-50091_SCH5140682]OBC11932.1 hypothetical protein A5784_03655 [Mycobacterium sp. 852013-50091_SCH5140682]